MDTLNGKLGLTNLLWLSIWRIRRRRRRPSPFYCTVLSSQPLGHFARAQSSDKVAVLQCQVNLVLLIPSQQRLLLLLFRGPINSHVKPLPLLTLLWPPIWCITRSTSKQTSRF